ncbi:MAG: redoxin domain-containing protein [Anaerolineales bacterium]|nr:redoxin domain-containing protein [Anaerolineales bacterium]
MAQLRQDYQQFVNLDAEIIVVGPEDEVAFKRYWERESLPFVGLSDAEHGVLKSYGQKINLFKFGRMPAQVLVDSSGIARFIHYGHSMKDIPPTSQITQLIEDLNRPSP